MKLKVLQARDTGSNPSANKIEQFWIKINIVNWCGLKIKIFM